MDEYRVSLAPLGEILKLLSNLLRIRVAFFGRRHVEVTGMDTGPMAAYCRRRRRQRAFDMRCRVCDARHVAEANRRRDACLYVCHAGLWEGAVPLYNRRGLYLGSIVFGQAYASGPKPPGIRPEELAALRRVDADEMARVARLLKMVSEYIIERELIAFRPAAWLRRVEAYLETHWLEKISLAELARHVGCSSSWLSHHFSLAFGVPLRTYLRHRRLAEARRLVEESGARLADIAARTGFYDEFHLSRAFKARYGHPPSALRPPR